LVSSGWSLSALPPKADIREREWHVRYVPKADFDLGVKVETGRGERKPGFPE
jgi:hypothetical protein